MFSTVRFTVAVKEGGTMGVAGSAALATATHATNRAARAVNLASRHTHAHQCQQASNKSHGGMRGSATPRHVT